MTQSMGLTRRPFEAAAPPRRRSTLLAAGRDHAIVASAQGVAGLGNLAFIAIAARVLPPAEFGHLASFVALLTALHLPGAGLAAAGALSHRAVQLARRCAAMGLAVGIGLVALAGPVAGLVGLPVPFVLALAAAAPAAPVLGMRRGLAYGSRDHGAVARSLLAEPAARLALGLTLALAAGGAAAAWGVVAGGWLALLSLRGSDRSDPPAANARGTAAAAVTFTALAVLQHQDLVLANRVLDGADAGAFAALSTLGGLVAFATATLPLVLLPASARDEADSLPVALGAAVTIGAGAVIAANIAAEPLVLAVVGPRYDHIAPLVPPYLAAMGALGVARVLAAHRCGNGGARRAAGIVVGLAIAHAFAVLAFAHTPGQLVGVTGVTVAGAAATFVLPGGWVTPAHRKRWATRCADRLRRPDVVPLLILTAAAVAIRLATERSLWVDEAISLDQAGHPFFEMLADLRATDVHPPLHHAVLWLTVRVLGTAEWAVRLPSVLLGAALVPVLFGASRELFDQRTARVTAVLAVPAPLLVWYSQEARMYALVMLLGVLAVWAQAAAVRTGGTSAFVAWGAANAAMVWTQWFAVLPIAAQHVAMVTFVIRQRDRARARRLLAGSAVSLAVLVVLALPVLGFLTDQLAAYGGRGQGLSMPSTAGADSSDVAGDLSPYAVIANLAWAVAGYHADGVMAQLGALWPLGMLGCLLLLGRRLGWPSRLLLSVALLPPAVLFAIAHTKRDLFELRYFILTAPVLVILIARAAATGITPARPLAAVTAGLVALSSLALVDQQVNGTNPRLYDFKGATARIEETAHPGDVLAHAPGYLDGVLSYYAPELVTMPLDDVDPDEVKGQIYVVVAERFIATRASAGAVGDALARIEQRRGEPERFERPNVVVWRFS